MATTIEDFYRGTTKKFAARCMNGGVAQDISADAVTLYLKRLPADTDLEAGLIKAADVTTQGADGYALFVLTTSDTNIKARTYFIEIEWELASGEKHVIYPRGTEHTRVEIFERIADV